MRAASVFWTRNHGDQFNSPYLRAAAERYETQETYILIHSQSKDKSRALRDDKKKNYLEEIHISLISRKQTSRLWRVF